MWWGNQMYRTVKHLELLNHRLTLKYSKWTLEYECLFLLWEMSSLSVELLKGKNESSHKEDLNASQNWYQVLQYFSFYFFFSSYFSSLFTSQIPVLGSQLLRSVIINPGAVNYSWGRHSHVYSGLSCPKPCSCC